MRSILVGLMGLNFLLAEAHAQTFPSRGVVIIVASTPGSVPDVLARGVGERLQQKWKQNVTIENRAGGAYTIAANAVLATPSDGYTLLATELGFYTTQPHLSKTKRYDATGDFIGVAGMASAPLAFLAHPSLPASSIGELVALAKQNPGSINYGTAGPGTAPHMGVLLLESLAGIKMTPVHYRGVSLAVNDLVAGHVKLLAIAPASAMSNYRAGALKMLAVGSARRSSALNEVPAVSETVPGFDVTVSFGLLARMGTSSAIVSQINNDVQEIVRDAKFKAQFLDPQVLEPLIGSPADLKRYLDTESDKWANLIRQTQLVVE